MKERGVLIKHGKMTPKLRSVLTAIFVQYSCRSPPDADATAVYLMFPEAARLWYRCGLKIASLQTVIKDRPDNAKHVYLKDFFAVVEGVLEEDERVAARSPLDRIDPTLQVSVLCYSASLLLRLRKAVGSVVVFFHFCRLEIKSSSLMVTKSLVTPLAVHCSQVKEELSSTFRMVQMEKGMHWDKPQILVYLQLPASSHCIIFICILDDL